MSLLNLTIHLEKINQNISSEKAKIFNTPDLTFWRAICVFPSSRTFLNVSRIPLEDESVSYGIFF